MMGHSDLVTPLSAVKMQQAPICRSFAATGHCSYGSRCRFFHAAVGSSAPHETSSSGSDYSRDPLHHRGDAAVRGQRSLPWSSRGQRGGWDWGQGRGGRIYGASRGERPLGPGHDIRRWLYDSKHQGKASRGSFMVVSYNILSSQLAADHVQELYWHVPPAVLAWESRRGAILRELEQMGPSIIGLQEVDHFDELQEELAGLGYEGTFKGRTGAEMTDGCATFWKAEEFTVEAVEELEFKDLNLRENVALLTVLKQQGASEAPARRVVVANTHILFNPKRGDIKLAQLRHLLEQAGELAKLYGNAPMVILGDFNSSPESALYHFLSTGQLDLAATDRRNMSGQMEGHFHDGRLWQPYRPSTRIQIPKTPKMPEPRRSLMTGQAEAASTSDEATRGPPDEAEALSPPLGTGTASPPSFKGLSASLGGALRNEPGLEPQLEQLEEAGWSDGLLASGDSDRDEGTGTDPGRDHALRRRRERSGEGVGEWESEWKRSREGESGESECVRTIGFTHAGLEGLSPSNGLGMGAAEAAGPPGATSHAHTTASGGPRGGWQSQSRSNWGRRRPPGIDYVWDDEEFLIAAGGGTDSVVRHPLKGLKSAYATVRKARFRGEAACAREPACTTYHGRARGTVDYIWFTPGLHPLRVLDTLPMQSVQRLRGLPTERWPSDHFCVACEFAFDAAIR